MSKLAVGPDDIDAIIFDFGGVLFNIDYHKPIAAFRELGMTNFDEIYSQAQQSDLFDDLEVGKIGKDEFLAGLRRHNSRPLSDDQLLEAWNVILLDIPKERIDEVKRLKQGFRTFLLSNTNALHVTAFEDIIEQTMGIAHFRSAFEHIHYSNELGLKKPGVEIYHRLVELHGLTPNRTLFIDDTVRHVDGARKAGLHAHHFEVGKDEIAELFKEW